jgi:hypothetical protein
MELPEKVRGALDECPREGGVCRSVIEGIETVRTSLHSCDPIRILLCDCAHATNLARGSSPTQPAPSPVTIPVYASALHAFLPTSVYLPYALFAKGILFTGPRASSGADTTSPQTPPPARTRICAGPSACAVLIHLVARHRSLTGTLGSPSS